MYTATIDHSLSIGQMIAAGDYDDSPSHDVIARRCRFERNDYREETRLELVPLDTEMKTVAAIKLLLKRGFAPANFFELLAFGAKYKNEPPAWHNVVALGTRNCGARLVGYIVRPTPHSRILCAYPPDAEDSWDKDCLLLARR